MTLACQRACPCHDPCPKCGGLVNHFLDPVWGAYISCWQCGKSFELVNPGQVTWTRHMGAHYESASSS